MTMQSRVNECAKIYSILIKQVTRAIKQREMSLLNLSTESGIAQERLTAIIEGRSREVTLRELAGLSLSLSVSLETLIEES